MLAYALVGSESYRSWKWFLKLFNKAFSWFRKSPDSIIISYRDKGLIRACKTVFEHIPHHWCAVHLKRNMMSKGGASNNQTAAIWLARMVKARNVSKFNQASRGLRVNFGDRMWKWIKAIPPQHYAKYASARRRWGIYDSNAAETLNARFRRIRMLPPARAVAELYYYMMERFAERRDTANRHMMELTPHAETYAADKFERALAMKATHSSSTRGLVDNLSTKNDRRHTYVMDMEKK